MLNNFSKLAAALSPRPYHSAEQVNLTLTFEVGTGEWDDSGLNDVERTEAVIIKTAVRIERLAQTDEMPGTDASTVYVKGRCVEPLLLPITIQPSMRANAVLIDRSRGSQIEGEFTLSVLMPGRYPEIDRKLGSRIEGMLRVTGIG